MTAELRINEKDTGYRGIWYMVCPDDTVYRYKYSGGMGTYCAKHQPFAIYAPEVHKTFFCYGGAKPEDNGALVHMVSYYDHATGTVPRPTFVMDKNTNDAHDNPVISIDAGGHIWIFSTSHGTGRPSFMHRSREPYSIDTFELVDPVRMTEAGSVEPFTNFSYFQAWARAEGGFQAFMTHYCNPAYRTIFYGRSDDGVTWDRPVRLAAIDEGHYQVSYSRAARSGCAFNYHPTPGANEKGPGIDRRTNLFYIETPDEGETWKNAAGERLELPLVTPDNPALVHDYRAEGLTVYMKDITLTPEGDPVILYLLSPGVELGPKNMPRVTTTARWNGSTWIRRPVYESDNNYDTGSLIIESSTHWRVIGPSGNGPQPWNPGGAIAMWESHDAGATWEITREITKDTPRNHNYVRRPVNAHPDFYGFWADGHGLEPSESRLYFCNARGEAFILPAGMDGDNAKPEPLRPV